MSIGRNHPDKSSGHTHTGGIDIQPHTTQTINERTSAESDPVVKTAVPGVASCGADFYKCGMQALVHRWRKCITNGGD